MFLNLLFGFTIADLKCREYIAKAKIMGQTFTGEPLPLIIAGGKTIDGEFPHMTNYRISNYKAHIGYIEKGSKKLTWACGGSLISELFILTAAHCMDDTEIGVPRLIRLGGSNINYQKNSQWRVVKEIIKYPGREGFYNDIALIRLDHPVTFNNYVRPTCLDTCKECRFKKAIATGFGAEEYPSSDMSDHLLKTNLEIYPNANCSNIHAQTIKNFLPEGVLKSQLCAGSIEGNDTCHGDSGGPLQIQLDNAFYMYRIIGITSFGLFCGLPNTPSFYTRISHYVKWIENVVWL